MKAPMNQVSDDVAQANLHRCTCHNGGDGIRPQVHDVTCEYAIWYYQLRDTPPDRRRPDQSSYGAYISGQNPIDPRD